MSLPQTYVGVDIAKNWIDIFDPETNTAQQISARPKRLTEYAQTLTGTIVVFEASGGYERLLMDTLAAHNIAYVRVNPRQSREFARATGRLAKTDKVDAKVLAQMGAALRLAPTPHLDKTVRSLLI